MPEKRFVQRKEPFSEFKVFDKFTGELIGFVSNICSKGMKLECLSPMIPGVEVDLTVHIPDFPEDRNKFSLTGICIWWIMNQEKNSYNCGIEIGSITPQDKTILKSVINELCE